MGDVKKQVIQGEGFESKTSSLYQEELFIQGKEFKSKFPPVRYTPTFCRSRDSPMNLSDSTAARGTAPDGSTHNFIRCHDNSVALMISSSLTSMTSSTYSLMTGHVHSPQPMRRPSAMLFG